MDFLSLENLSTLLMLIVLQAVLGFDNLLYISLESKRVAPERQAFVRRMGIGLAIVLRIVLLFLVIEAIETFQGTFAEAHWAGVVDFAFNLQSTVTLFGGIFILYTAIKEILHMLTLEKLGEHANSGNRRSVGSAIFWIVAMNLVFSFDSILSAMALTDVFWVMATSILICGGLMVWLSDYVAEFLEKNRMYEVLGLFILLLVGVLLVSEGGHLAHLQLAGYAIEPMAKSTFYFVIAVIVLVDVVQTRYQKKIMAQRAAGTAHAAA